MVKFYFRFKIPVNAQIKVTIKHGGLRGKVLSSSSPNCSLFSQYTADTEEVPTIIITTLDVIISVGYRVKSLQGTQFY
jgi:hypothetical protein